MTRYVFALALAWLVSVALGQSQSPQVFTPQEAAEIIRQATGEILVQAKLLDQKPLAEALRLARTERGVKVYLLTTASGLTHRASYAPSLALAGVVVRYAPEVSGEFVVVDRRLGLSVKRDYLATTLHPEKPEPLVERFYYAFLRAIPFSVEDWVHRMYLEEYMKGGNR